MRRDSLILLWLAGNSLRMTILAVPPVLPSIHRRLHLNEAEIGALSNLPVLLIAAGAVFGALLVARLGPRRALLTGLITIALAGAVRAVGPSVPILFAGTIAMGLGVSMSQPSLPSLVRQWLPSRSALGTAAFSNGFLIGEVVAASLTAPLLADLLGGWQPALAIWSVPVLLTAILVTWRTAEGTIGTGQPMRWWPDWRNALTWRLGLILGCASASYFGCNAFIPDFLKATHHAALIPIALTSLNLCQLPASVLTALMPHRLVGHRWPLAVSGAAILVSAIGLWLGGAWVVLFAGAIGLFSAAVFVLSLALPPVLAEAHDVHRLTAAMFTISYTFPFIASLIAGSVWDLSGRAEATFLPVAFVGLLMAALVYGLDLSGYRDAQLPIRETL